MGTHQVIDSNGHTTFEFDKADPAQLAAAEARFRELVGLPSEGNPKGGHAAATRKAGETEYRRIKDPADQEDVTIFVPPLAGG